VSETGEVKCQQTTKIAVGKVCGARENSQQPSGICTFCTMFALRGGRWKWGGRGIVGSPNVIVKSNGGSLPSISSIFTSLYSTLRGIVAQLRNAKNRVARSMNYNVESFNTYCVRRWAENPVG